MIDPCEKEQPGSYQHQIYLRFISIECNLRSISVIFLRSISIVLYLRLRTYLPRMTEPKIYRYSDFNTITTK